MSTVAARLLSDRAKFLNTSDFGTSVNYTPASDGARDIDVQWFEAPSTDGPLGIKYESSSPRVLGSVDDFPSAAHNDVIVKDGVTYYIRGIEKNGDGMVWLTLSRN